jgi:hypothetical protein
LSPWLQKKDGTAWYSHLIFPRANDAVLHLSWPTSLAKQDIVFRCRNPSFCIKGNLAAHVPTVSIASY